MENFVTIKNEIEKSVLIKIYRTLKPISEFWFEGLGNLLTYSYILETDQKIKYEFSYDFISSWVTNNKLIELESNFKKQFQNQKIIELIKEKEFGGIYIKLENGMVLNHNTNFGSELGFEEFSNLFDLENKLID